MSEEALLDLGNNPTPSSPKEAPEITAIEPEATLTEEIPYADGHPPQEQETPVANGTHPSPPETSTPSSETESTQDQDVADDTKEETPAQDDPRLVEIMEKFGGRWKMVRSDPYDQYLKTLGAGYFTRKIAGRAYHDMKVSLEGANILVAMRSMLHNQHYSFKLDEEVENTVEKTKHGVVCTYEDGKLLHQMTPTDASCKTLQHVERSINDDGEHVVVFTAGEAVCKRYYARVPIPASTKTTKKEKDQGTELNDQQAEETDKSAEQKDESSKEKDEAVELKDEAAEQKDESAEAKDESSEQTTETSEETSKPSEKTEESEPTTESSPSA